MSRLYIDQSSRVYVDRSSWLFVDSTVPVIPPLYSLWVDSLTANETTDNTITFYLSAQNINVINLPMTVPFKVIGQVDKNDFIVGTQLSGTFVLSDNNTVASKTFEVLADSTTEGDETMTLVLTSVAGIACPLEAENLSQSVLIYDTSLFPPGYTLSINPTQANETTSNVFDIKLTTTGVANGTKIPFRMTGVGISAVDLTGVTALTGFFEVTGASEPIDITPVVTTLTYTITADQITEGTEVLTVTLSSDGGISCPIEAEGLSKQIPIYDTSREVGTATLLLNGNGPGIFDTTIYNSSITVNGNTSISTSVKKYGSGSLYFDGTNDWIQIPGGSHFAYGTGNFTIEFWCNFTRVTVPSDVWNPRIISQGTNNSTRLQIYIEDTTTGSGGTGVIGELVLYTNSLISKTNMAVNDGNWHHIAFARQNGTMRTFVDGVLKDTRANSTNFNDIITGYTMGAYNNSTSGDYLGYIDDLRITKGAALYTSNFTPPTEELTINV